MRCLLCLILAASASVATATDFEHRYYAAALSGDLSWVADARPATGTGQQLQEQFSARFLDGISDTGNIDDPLALAVAAEYHDYWRTSLLAPNDIALAEQHLQSELESLLARSGYAVDEDVDATLARALAERGYSISSGRSMPLIDLVMWRRSATVKYDVELTDDHQPVTVHLLRDVVVRGWTDFATFGRAGSGGWADQAALYCITDVYDLRSEQFRNSFLRHEARHFADFAKFPGLSAVDLEYRGKLTELAFSTDAHRLIAWFWRNSDVDSAAPHPLANWRTVWRMASTVDADCDKGPKQCFASASNEQLQRAARDLLEADTDRLEVAGQGLDSQSYSD